MTSIINSGRLAAGGGGGGSPVFTTNGTESNGGAASLGDANTSTNCVALSIAGGSYVQYIKIDNNGVPINSIKCYFTGPADAINVYVYRSASGSYGSKTEVEHYSATSGSSSPKTSTFPGTDTFAFVTVEGPPFPASVTFKEIEVT